MGALGSCAAAEIPTSPFPAPLLALTERFWGLCSSLVCCCDPPQKYLPVISETDVDFAGPLRQLGGDAWLRKIIPHCQVSPARELPPVNNTAS